MSKQRLISTAFWKDTYIADLDPTEKLLFLYLLTNHQTNVAGIYELSLREMAFDTGIDKDMIVKILARFQKDGKLYYKNNWIALYNWIKHQARNPKVAAGVERIIDDLPEWLRKDLLDPDDPQTNLLDDSLSKPMDSLSKPIVLNLTKLNLTKPNAHAPTAKAEMPKGNKRINGKTYAKAVEADKELSVKETMAKSRVGGGYENARAVAEKLKEKMRS